MEFHSSVAKGAAEAFLGTSLPPVSQAGSTVPHGSEVTRPRAPESPDCLRLTSTHHGPQGLRGTSGQAVYSHALRAEKCSVLSAAMRRKTFVYPEPFPL